MIATPDRSLYRHSSFISIWLGEAASSLGGSFGTVANSWLLYQLTGTGLEAALGSMWLIYMVPSLAVQLVIGPFLDRWNKQHVLFYAQAARALLFCFPLLMSIAGQLQPWHIFVVSLGNGLIQPLYVPASMALLPSLLESRQLPKANAAVDGTSRLMMFIGPPAGGLLVALIGAELTLLGIVALYVASSLLLAKCGSPVQDGRQSQHENEGNQSKRENQEIQPKRESWLDQFLAGYRYFFRQKLLVWLSVFLAFVQFAVGATMVLNLPFVVQELGGSSFVYGLFVAMFPLGYFLGSLLLPRFTLYVRPTLSVRLTLYVPLRLVMLGAIGIGGATFIGLAFVQHVWLALLLELLAGIASPFFSVHSTTLYQQTVPAALRGRVFSVRLLIIRSVMPLGTLFGSICAPIMGVRPIFIAIGGVICIAALVGMVVPWFRFLDGREGVGERG